jgi:hypothetical protein
MYTPAVCGANTTIRRIIPHPFVPGILIPGTRSASPPSALCQARSPTHRRHTLVLTLGTTPYPFPAPLRPYSSLDVLSPISYHPRA